MKRWGLVLLVYFLVTIGSLCAAYFSSEAVTTAVQNRPLERKYCIIIDAGHGGEDGGATSCSGVLESQLNLEISLRLNDLLHLLGYKTAMIRTTDTAIYTEGESLSAKKISDLKNRVAIVNQTDNALLVSIHQNTFADSRYSGAQVFHARDTQSQKLAQSLQSAFAATINPGSNRKCKPSDGIYLMQHIDKPGVLVECGFISNPQEAQMLGRPDYQQKIACVIASEICRYCT